MKNLYQLKKRDGSDWGDQALTIEDINELLLTAVERVNYLENELRGYTNPDDKELVDAIREAYETTEQQLDLLGGEG